MVEQTCPVCGAGFVHVGGDDPTPPVPAHRLPEPAGYHPRWGISYTATGPWCAGGPIGAW